MISLLPILQPEANKNEEKGKNGGGDFALSLCVLFSQAQESLVAQSGAGPRLVGLVPPVPWPSPPEMP